MRAADRTNLTAELEALNALEEVLAFYRDFKRQLLQELVVSGQLASKVQDTPLEQLDPELTRLERLTHTAPPVLVRLIEFGQAVEGFDDRGPEAAARLDRMIPDQDGSGLAQAGAFELLVRAIETYQEEIESVEMLGKVMGANAKALRADVQMAERLKRAVRYAWASWNESQALSQAMSSPNRSAGQIQEHVQQARARLRAQMKRRPGA